MGRLIMPYVKTGNPIGRPRKGADPAFPKRRANATATEQAGNGNPEEDTEADREFVLRQSPQEPEISTAEIGLSADPPPLAESTPETDTYLCGRCRSPIEHGTGYCPICNARLNW